MAVVTKGAVRRAFWSPWLVPGAWILAMVEGAGFLLLRPTGVGPFAAAVVVVRLALIVVIVLSVVVVGGVLLAPLGRRLGAGRGAAGAIASGRQHGSEDGSA